MTAELERRLRTLGGSKADKEILYPVADFSPMRRFALNEEATFVAATDWMNRALLTPPERDRENLAGDSVVSHTSGWPFSSPSSIAKSFMLQTLDGQLLSVYHENVAVLHGARGLQRCVNQHVAAGQRGMQREVGDGQIC